MNTAPLFDNTALIESLEDYDSRMAHAMLRLSYPKKNYQPADTARLKELDPFVQAFAAAFPNVPFCIAGGAVRDTLLGAKPKDYDVFILLGDLPTSPSTFAIKAGIRAMTVVVENLYRGLVENNVLEASEVTRSIPWADLLRGTKSGKHPLAALLTNSIIDGKSFQFIVYFNLSTPQELISEFDLNFCKFAYNQQGLIHSELDTPDTLYAVASGTRPLLASHVRFESHTLYRLLKFAVEFDCDVQQAIQDLAQGLPRDPVNFLTHYEGQEIEPEIWKLHSLLVEEKPEYAQFDALIDGIIEGAPPNDSGYDPIFFPS